MLRKRDFSHFTYPLRYIAFLKDQLFRFKPQLCSVVGCREVKSGADSMWEVVLSLRGLEDPGCEIAGEVIVNENRLILWRDKVWLVAQVVDQQGLTCDSYYAADDGAFKATIYEVGDFILEDKHASDRDS